MCLPITHDLYLLLPKNKILNMSRCILIPASKVNFSSSFLNPNLITSNNGHLTLVFHHHVLIKCLKNNSINWSHPFQEKPLSGMRLVVTRRDEAKGCPCKQSPFLWNREIFMSLFCPDTMIFVASGTAVVTALLYNWLVITVLGEWPRHRKMLVK